MQTNAKSTKNNQRTRKVVDRNNVTVTTGTQIVPLALQGDLTDDDNQNSEVYSRNPKALSRELGALSRELEELSPENNQERLIEYDEMLQDETGNRYDTATRNEGMLGAMQDYDQIDQRYGSRKMGRNRDRSTGQTGDIDTRDKYDRFIGRVRVEGTDDLDDIKVPINRSIEIKDIDISKSEPNPIMYGNVDYARFSLGFHHWIHASKNKTVVFEKYAKKKKVYQIMNGYERYVDDYEESIGNISSKFFGSDGRPEILSRAFYKLWEILNYYDLIDLDNKNFSSAHLAEGPGSFIQATIFFRDMYAKESKNDKYYATTLYWEDGEHQLDMEKKFIDHYGKEKPQRFFMHKSYDLKTANGSESKDNGDLTIAKTIRNFKKTVNGRVDFVTGDGGFEWGNENIQEQEGAVLIYGQILTALNIQKKGGSFVLKVFEMFTKMSAKFIIILRHFYKKVDLIKPLTSRESNSERYIVCRDFKYNEKEISAILEKMMAVLDKYNEYKKTVKTPFLIDLFPDIVVPDELMLNLLSVNIEISNQQYKVINKMIEYLEGSNFHGEMYVRYRDRQIRLTQYWIDIFLNKDMTKSREMARKILETSERKQKSEYNKLKNHLIGYDVAKDMAKDTVQPVKPVEPTATAKTTTVADNKKNVAKKIEKPNKKMGRSKTKSRSSKGKKTKTSRSTSGSKDKKKKTTKKK
jgi:23S rRNA U2552 (ribose-2'-O)-methylase RlmE/FtsJ